MARDILSAKLCELDQKIGLLHSRISLSQTGSAEDLQSEISSLQQICTEEETTLRTRMQYSRADTVRCLADPAEQLFQDLEGMDLQAVPDTDEKLLLAEYALDFAMYTADRSVLICLEAIAAQSPDEEEAI